MEKLFRRVSHLNPGLSLCGLHSYRHHRLFSDRFLPYVFGGKVQNTRIFWTASRKMTLAGGRPVHVSTTWRAIWSPAMPFLGEIGKGTHVHFNTVTAMPTREEPRTSWPPMFASLFFGTILASAWPHFCSLVLVGWLALALVRKRTEKSSGKVQDVTENWVVNQGWAGLHCVKSARVLVGCGQEMGLLSQWRGPCSMSQGPRTDTP